MIVAENADEFWKFATINKHCAMFPYHLKIAPGFPSPRHVSSPWNQQKLWNAMTWMETPPMTH